MSDDSPSIDGFLLTACHEAGHAIAVQMRGGTVTSITIDPGLTTYKMPHHRVIRFRNGEMVKNPQPPDRMTADDGFIAYAGSWAETRCRWPMPTLDTRDEHGRTFSEYVAAILQMNTRDFATYQEAAKPPDAEQLWTAELEQQWPRIKLAAGRMFAAHREDQRRQVEKRRRQVEKRRRQVRRALNRHRSVRQHK